MIPSLINQLDPAVLLYILTAISVIALLLVAWVIRLEVKLRRFTLGKDGTSLEGSVVLLKKQYDETLRFRADIEKYLRSVEERLRRSIQGTETIRFNPFQGDGSGGNQSFATALMNEAGDGVVFSSIYARDRMCVFAKPVKNFGSEHELSTEENEALKKARVSLAALKSE